VAQDGDITYDLTRLAHILAEETFGDQYYLNYKDFGDVDGFGDQYRTIRLGRRLNTNHLLFLGLDRYKIAIDEYGDVWRYTNHHIESALCCIAADALRTYRERAEPQHLEVESWDLP
jgi:hypothetical protein